MKDGASWEDAADTGETYDLIVVGGGISCAIDQAHRAVQELVALAD